MLRGSYGAEMTKLVRRPASWLLLAIAVVIGLLFVYVIPYAGAVTGSGGPNSDRGIDAMLPANLVGNSLGGLPVFLGALFVILGVLTVGGEYGWGTWKTVLTQGPSRLTVLAGKVGALVTAALATILLTFGIFAVAAVVVALAQDRSLAFPPALDLLRGIGAGWLIASMWTMFGALLAILLRGVALAVGLALVWMLAIQNLVSLLAAPLLPWVDDLQKGLPGPGAGALASALGSGSETPGVAAVVGGGTATLVVAAYLVGFVAVGAAVLRRRDIL